MVSDNDSGDGKGECFGPVNVTKCAIYPALLPLPRLRGNIISLLSKEV
jgi:hypothetical protein